MNKLKRKWKNGDEFSKNTLKLVSGTLIAQALSILVIPLISQLYSVTEFGLFSLVTSIVSLLILVSGGRFEVAVLLPKKTTDAVNLLALALLMNVGMLVLFYTVLILLDVFFGTNQLGIWYYLLPVFVFVAGITQVISAWFTRRKKYREMVYFRVSQSFLNSGFSIGNGLVKMATNGLLSAFLISNILTFIVVLVQLKEDRKLLLKCVSGSKMKELAKKYHRFPLYNSFQSLLDASQINGLIYLISYTFGQYFVGIFSMATRIMFMPMNLVGSSISQVFYQEATDLEKEGKSLLPLMRKTLKQASVLILPVLLIILFLGPFVFSFVLGNAWENSGRFSQYLAPWICLDFVRAPLSQIPLVINKQRQMLSFTLLSNVMVLLAFLGAEFYFHEMKWILISVSMVQVAYIFTLLLWIFKVAHTHDKNKNQLS